MEPIPDSVRTILLERRETLRAELATVSAPIMTMIADIDLVLGLQNSAGAPANIPAVVVDSAPSGGVVFNTASIVDATEKLISASASATTDAVLQTLLAAGVAVPVDAKARITKALTRTGRYRGHKTRGWSHRVPPKKTDWPLPAQAEIAPCRDDKADRDVPGFKIPAENLALSVNSTRPNLGLLITLLR